MSRPRSNSTMSMDRISFPRRSSNTGKEKLQTPVPQDLDPVSFRCRLLEIQLLHEGLIRDFIIFEMQQIANNRQVGRANNLMKELGAVMELLNKTPSEGGQDAMPNSVDNTERHE